MGGSFHARSRAPGGHVHGHLQGEGDHLGEGGLALGGGEGLAGQQVVRNGADGQSPLAGLRRVAVKGRALHLYGQHAQPAPGQSILRPAVKDIGAEQVAHGGLHAQAVGRRHGALQQRKVRDGREGAVQPVLPGVVGVGAGGLAEHHIPQLQPGRDGAHAAHADDVVHVVGVKQLVRVDAHGGHAHA